MDAKPQRMIRTMRIHGDQNLPPTLPTNKAIHQRNKSTPALSTMAGTAGLRAAARRTAFGDVSNTMSHMRSTKDDSIVSVKTLDENYEKDVQLQQSKKSAALLRPAQRPLSVAGLKGLLSTVTNTGATENVPPKVDVLEYNPNLQPPNSRKVMSKRSTTIFKDPVLPSVEEKIIEAPKEARAGASNAPVHQALIPRVALPEASIITHSNQSDSTISEVDTSDEATVDLQPLTNSTSASVKASVVRSDGLFIDPNGDIRIYQDHDSPEQEVAPAVAPAEATNVPVRPALFDLAQQDKAKAHTLHSEFNANNGAPQQSEPEEYWDDEEDENYEEDGYVTARSYRSLGGNTTGGATIVLFPAMNQKIKREIAAAKSLVEGSRTTEEIEDDSWDTSMVAEYGDEIFEYMRELEIKMLPNAHYMENQAEIQWSMRSVLMDWLVQVHHRFSLLPETLFLCVNYIDRFLSCKIVSLGKLQLVGATAIFIAAKYEEINCPSVQEIVYMVDGGYTIDEILKAERFMLSMLQFELGWPGPMSFLRRISKADDYDLETRTLAKYFLEVTIMDERFVGSPPSYAAAGAHCLARLMLKKGNWTPHHVYYSNYTYAQLLPILTLILECCDNPQKHHAAVFEKYCDKRYKKASIFAQAEVMSTLELLRGDRDSGLHRHFR